MGAIFPSALVLRRRNRVEADAAIREERLMKDTAWKVLLPAFAAYAGVDWIAANFQHFWIFFSARVCSFFFGIFLYYVLRGRVGHSVRFLLLPSIFTFTIQLIMIATDVEYSPYFAGVGLILIQMLVYSPKDTKWVAIFFTLACLPSFISFGMEFSTSPQRSLIGLTMLLGTIATCITHTQRIRDYIFDAFKARRDLDKELRGRTEQVRLQADELIKRRQFDAQFSPQVVTEVMASLDRFKELKSEEISVLVCDIVGSSRKSNELKPDAYSEVIEEIFDIISAGCLRWDLTVDKFTGDGAQAFAGSPKKRPDDLARTVKACYEIQRLLRARKDYLELRWKGPVELRFGICEGEALVGFLGKGAMKSFTAIGTNVSLAHRLCGEARPGRILLLSLLPRTIDELVSQVPASGYKYKAQNVTKLKGFEDSTFRALELEPHIIVEQERAESNLGRCKTCATPLILEETSTGIPKVVCPACSLKAEGKSSASTTAKRVS